MKVLGLRAEPRQFQWAVVEGTKTSAEVVAHGCETMPAESEEAEGLRALRDSALLVLDAQEPDAAALRAAETFGPGGKTDSARRRLRVEGVLLETMASRSLPVSGAVLVTIASRLKKKPASVKGYIEHGKICKLDMTHVKGIGREAVLVAFSALPDA